MTIWMAGNNSVTLRYKDYRRDATNRQRTVTLSLLPTLILRLPSQLMSVSHGIGGLIILFERLGRAKDSVALHAALMRFLPSLRMAASGQERIIALTPYPACQLTLLC